MPKIDPNEFFSDRTKFPDDMEISLPNGDVISVKDYRDKAMPKADFTRATEQYAQRERELRGNLETASQNLAQAMQERQALLERANANQPPATPTGGIRQEDLLNDPVLGPMVRDLKETRERLDRFQTEAAQRLTQHEQTWTRREFESAIARMAERDKSFNQQEFLEYAGKYPSVNVETKQIDLDRTYRAYAFDKAQTEAEKRGEERGVEKGRKAATVPRVPFGRRSSPTKTDDGTPKTVQEIKVDDVLNDDEIMSQLRGE